MTRTISGGCLCGACTYRTQAEPINIRVCHCTLCQKATGAPFFVRVLVPLDRLEMAGPLRWYHSSPKLRRGSCSTCGTILFTERASENVVGLSIGSLDEPDACPPQEHVWVSEKRDWLCLDDGLPMYEGPVSA